MDFWPELATSPMVALVRVFGGSVGKTGGSLAARAHAGGAKSATPRAAPLGIYGENAVTSVTPAAKAGSKG